MDPHDPLESCPYNPSHRVSRSRMQYHLVKCGKQHKKTTKIHCHFDSTHVVEEVEYESHINQCPSSANIHLSRYVTPIPQELGIPLAEANNIKVPTPREDWDKESVCTRSYKPEDHIENRNVLRVAMVVPKAERKNFRRTERQRLQILSENVHQQSFTGPPPLPPSLQQKPLRLPRNVVDAEPPVITRSNAKDKSLEILEASDSGNSCSKRSQKFHEKGNSQDFIENVPVTHSLNAKSKEISFNSLDKPRNASSSLLNATEEEQTIVAETSMLSKLSLDSNRSAGNSSFSNHGNQMLKLPPTGRGCSRLYKQIQTQKSGPGAREEKFSVTG